MSKKSRRVPYEPKGRIVFGKVVNCEFCTGRGYRKHAHDPKKYPCQDCGGTGIRERET